MSLIVALLLFLADEKCEHDRYVEQTKTRIVHLNNDETYNFITFNCECKSYRICIRKRRNRKSTKCRKLRRRTLLRDPSDVWRNLARIQALKMWSPRCYLLLSKHLTIALSYKTGSTSILRTVHKYKQKKS